MSRRHTGGPTLALFGAVALALTAVYGGTGKQQLHSHLAASTGVCPVFRAAIKLAEDPGVGSVNTNVSVTTIAAMRAFAPPGSLGSTRIPPPETHIYSIDATLTGYVLDTDSDYHLVIQDASGNTMIVAIPDPLCVTTSVYSPAIRNARMEFDARYTPTTSLQATSIAVRVKGIGFFNAIHGTAGQAPNGIELHPVLDILFNPGPLSPQAVLPAVTNGAYGGYVTVATIKNTGIAPAAIRIDYFDQNGAPVGAGDGLDSLPVNASWTVRQDTGTSFPNSGGDAAQAGSAIVYANQPTAMFVNEFPPGYVGDATSYSGVQVANGVGTTLYAPTIVNNAYGGYTTGIGLLNEGSGPTNVTITYHDGAGTVVKSQTVTALAAHAYHALYSGDTALGLPSGFAGTATIVSSAGPPLGAVVNEIGPGGQFSSYDAVPLGSSLLNAPVALNNAFGGYYTGMGIQNTSASSGTVMVTYYDAGGAPTVKSFPIGANGSLRIYQGSVTDGPAVGAYTATIASTVAIAAIVNEVAPSSTSAKQSTSYNAFTFGSTTLHLALVENAGSDPWNTGDGIMNTGTTSTTVTVTYYNTSSGAAVGTPQTQVLAPHAFWGLYQPTGGLPTGTRATAVITTSSGGQVAAICNESSATTFMSYDGQ